MFLQRIRQMCGSCQKNQLEDASVPRMCNTEGISQSSGMENPEVVTTQAHSRPDPQKNSPKSQSDSKQTMKVNSQHSASPQEGDGQNGSAFSTGTLQETRENPSNICHFGCYSKPYGSALPPTLPPCPQSQPRPLRTDREVTPKHSANVFISPFQRIRFPCQVNNSLSIRKSTCVCGSAWPRSRVTPQEMTEFWKTKSNMQLHKHIGKNPEVIEQTSYHNRRPTDKIFHKSGCPKTTILKSSPTTFLGDTNKEAERESNSGRDDYNEGSSSVDEKGYTNIPAVKVDDKSDAQSRNTYNSLHQQNDANCCQYKYHSETISAINETRVSDMETPSHKILKQEKVADIQQMIFSINLQKTIRQALSMEQQLQSLRKRLQEDGRSEHLNSHAEMRASHSPTEGLQNLKYANKGDSVPLAEEKSPIDNDGQSLRNAEKSQNVRLMSDSLGSFSDISFSLPPVTAITSEDSMTLNSFSDIFEGCSPAKDLTLERTNVYKLAWSNSWLCDVSHGQLNVECTQSSYATRLPRGSDPENTHSSPCLSDNLERIFSPPDLVKDLKLPRIPSGENRKGAVEAEVNTTHYDRPGVVVNEEFGRNQDETPKPIFMSQSSLDLFKSPNSSTKKKTASQLSGNSTQGQRGAFSKETVFSPVLRRKRASVSPFVYYQERLARRVSTPISSLYSSHGSHVTVGCGKRESEGSYIWDDSFLFFDMSGSSETHEVQAARPYGEGFKSISSDTEECGHEKKSAVSTFECHACKNTASAMSSRRHSDYADAYLNGFCTTLGREEQGPIKSDAITESQSAQFLQLSPSSFLIPRSM